MTTTHTAHFTITGEGFTRIARDFFLSEMPSKAWRFIVNGLRSADGTTAEPYAAKILDGTMKLTGTEKDMHPVADKAKATKKYVETAKYIYAGRVKINGCWFRPKAEVTGFGPDDAKFASRQLRPDDEDIQSVAEGVASLRKWWFHRVKFYSNEGDKVVQLTKPGKKKPTFLIFEPCGEPPFWWKENLTPEEALADFLKAGRWLNQEECQPPPPEEAVAKAFTEAAEELKTAARAELDAEREAQSAVEDEWRKARIASIASIRQEVLEQAKGDMIDLTLKDGTVVPVPRAPFMHWALGRTSLKHMAPPWLPVSPSGMKLPLDDEFHTDWLIGAGQDLEESSYSGPLYDAAIHESAELQFRLGSFECMVIVDGPEVMGVVGKDIVVLPDLRPDHLERVVKARAVITQAGGKLAHLAQVAMERSIPMMLVSDACTRFIDGMTVTLCPKDGAITIRKTKG